MSCKFRNCVRASPSTKDHVREYVFRAAAARIKGRRHARAVVVEMPLSRFIVRQRGLSVHLRACTNARTSVRTHVTSDSCRVMHLPVRIRWRVINATSVDGLHLYRKRHVAYWLSLEETSGSENTFDAFSRESPYVASYKISFVSRSLTTERLHRETFITLKYSK